MVARRVRFPATLEPGNVPVMIPRRSAGESERQMSTTEIQGRAALNYAAVFRIASEEGEAASREARPTPMVVGNAVGLSDRIDPAGPLYYVAGGACGFAGVVIKDGRSGFARYCRTNRIGHRNYYGGHYVPARPQWCANSQLSQSLEIAEAYGRGFAEALRRLGIDCYVSSRMD
jgi:hypothetical protein